MNKYFTDHLNKLSLKQRQQLIGYTIDINIKSRYFNQNTENTNNRDNTKTNFSQNTHTNDNYKYGTSF